MVNDVIDFDMALEHPRADIWGLLQAPDWYPRFFRGIGSCDQTSGATPGQPLQFAVHLITPNGAVADHQMRLTVRKPGEEMRLEGTAVGSFVSVRLSTDRGRTRVGLTIFKAGLLHPGLAKVSNSAVQNWARDGLTRMADYLAGKESSVLVNMGELRSLQLSVAKTMITSGVVRAARPDRAIRQLNSLAKWGFTLAGGYAAAAARSPHNIALIDRYGEYTYQEVDERTTHIAAGLAVAGFTDTSRLAILARNHSAMVESMIASSKLGADIILLNTGLAPRQIEEIIDRNAIDAIFVDDEFEAQVRYLPEEVPRISTHPDSVAEGRYSIDDFVPSGADAGPLDPPEEAGQLVVLTSGTTGNPKGARRPTPRGFGTIAAMLSRMPLHRDEVILIPAPLFHTWGLAALQLSTPLRASVVLMERFDAEECLKTIALQRCTTLIAVPVMLQRILELPERVINRYDTSSLNVVATSGSPISGATVTRFMDTFGDVLYNFYGSTEVSWATIADPADLRATPTTAGRPPLGTRIAVLDQDGVPLPVGAVGRIFVGNEMLFDGYTNAAPPAIEDQLMSTGDLGYLDASGRLFVAGRDDEMIISGGENVFPRPVEEALANLPQIADVAVVGVPDKEFGQRLAAFVVRAEGASLDQDMIRTYIRHRLSRFSIPRDVTFVSYLPRTATGKILKRKLIDGQFEAEARSTG
ncbi:AMP-binding protein [Antrihabitans cavernicola]|uniref:AMP-binding protein n=1 Tax=Antrihabitans cavernicola TaxID=2495913 RepID=A0A5A7SIV6_9NOCA|nr:AMP-binding protein [Spelaeibacter cavernicola]KAA0024657.1 AMP-binding protein [Spelaeibacter cavernicola]